MAVTKRFAGVIPFTGTAADPVSLPYTMVNSVAGTGRALLVALMGFNDGTLAYNAAAASILETMTGQTSRFYYLPDASLPTDGLEHNFVCDFTAARTNFVLQVLEVDGATQPAIGTLVHALGNGGSVTPHPISITPVADAAPIFLFYARDESRTMSSQPAGTHHFSTNTGDVFLGQRITEVVGPTPAALTTYTWTPSSASTFRAFAIELAAEGGGAAKARYYSQLHDA